MDQRARLASRVPTIVVKDAITEADLVRGLELGAQDVVTLAARSRLQAVAAREIDAARLDHTLNGTLASARQYRDQMRAFMTGSTDAIAHVQEGIVVDANPAWCELFGRREASDLLGQPLMDLFHARTHAALKGALVASVQGRWAGHALNAAAVTADGGTLPLELRLERFEFDGEPAVRLRVATPKRDMETMAHQLDEALRRDSSTGLLRRTAFIDAVTARAAQPLKGGLRAIAYLAPDRPDMIERDHGPFQAEEIMDAIGRLVEAQLQPGDLGGRISARGIGLLFERGNARDQEHRGKRELDGLPDVLKVDNRNGHSYPSRCADGPTTVRLHGTETLALIGGRRAQLRGYSQTTPAVFRIDSLILSMTFSRRRARSSRR